MPRFPGTKLPFTLGKLASSSGNVICLRSLLSLS